MRGILLVFGAIACGNPSEATTDGDTDEPEGACGDVSEVDMALSGDVLGPDGAPAPGVRVALEERNWAPGTVHGEATTDAAGAFAFEAHDLPVVEGCWGVAVQFWLVGSSGDLYDEQPMNSQIVRAYNDGTLAVDLGQFPLTLH